MGEENGRYGCHRSREPRKFPLTLRGTGTVGSVRKLKRNAQLLFRRKSLGFVNPLLCQHLAKLAGTARSIRIGKRGCGFRFHSAVLHGNDMPLTTQDDDLVETPLPRHDRNTFAVRLGSRRLRQVHRARSGASISPYSCLTPLFLTAREAGFYHYFFPRSAKTRPASIAPSSPA